MLERSQLLLPCLFLSPPKKKEENLMKAFVFAQKMIRDFLVIHYKIRDVVKLHRPQIQLQLK